MADLIPLPDCPMPHEWTDDEWLRLTKELDPDEDISVAMRKVYEWRKNG